MPAAVAVPLILGGVSAGASIYGATRQSNAVRDSTRTQTQAANQAAALEAQIARDQLAFQQQQAKLTQANFDATQKFNRSVYTDQQARLTPYRQFGAGAIAQLGQPIPGGQ